MPANNKKPDQRLQVGYGSAWHLLRCLGWQRERFSRLIEREVGCTNVSWLDFPKYSGDMVYPKGNPILEGEWQRLEFLGKDHPLQAEYDTFWPRTRSQQNWDAVGTAMFGDTREWLLVEAKAHIDEIKDSGTGAKDATSKSMIREAFNQAQQCLRCTVPPETWLEHYYQYANRLATLYFLNEHVPAHRVPTRLVMVYFCGDTYSQGNCPATAREWEPTLTNLRRTLGVNGSSELKNRIHDVFVPVDLTTIT